MSAVVQFASTADHVLDLEEHLTELLDHLVELSQRLDTLEALAVENAGDGGEPLATILARLDAFDSRLAKLELRQRRPPPFSITVVEGDDSRTWRRVNEVSSELAVERGERARRDQDLHNAHQGFNGGMAAFRQDMAAFNARLNQCAAQFCRIRERVAVVEARTADKGE
jgi:uncharacterized protein YceH (UPF0502 family)